MSLLRQSFGLILIDSCETIHAEKKPLVSYSIVCLDARKWSMTICSPEHPNLIHNMIPVSRSVQLFREKTEQFFPHVNDPASHGLDITSPFVE